MVASRMSPVPPNDEEQAYHYNHHHTDDDFRSRHDPMVNGYEHQKAPSTGILRGPFELAIDSALPHGTQNVAFLDPPSERLQRSSRAVTPAQEEQQSVLSSQPPFDEPLIFTKRPTLSSGRSSFSCSTCGRSAPISPVSDDIGTPGLSRSETDLSEGVAPSSAAKGLCNHSNAASAASSSPHPLCSPSTHPHHVSLLTAALLAGDVSPRETPRTTSPPSNCGILKRDPTPAAKSISALLGGVTNELDSDSGMTSTTIDNQPQRPSGRPRFVEPPKPVRPNPRRVSLPPQQRPGHNLFASPDHYSEGPESPPRPVVIDSRSQVCYSPAPETRQSQKPIEGEQHGESSHATQSSSPIRKRALTFQDADEVRQRAAGKQSTDARGLPEVSPPSHADQRLTRMGVDTSTAVRLHPCDSVYLASRDGSQARRASGILSARHATPGGKGEHVPVDACKPVQAGQRQLKFAASPHELRVSRRPSQRLRSQRPSRSPSSSDDEGPYVDSVAVHGSVLAARGRPSSSLARANKQHGGGVPRSGSPAPKNLGGSEVGGKGTGQGRPRSPAPRGKVLIPHSFGSEQTDEVVVDDLDYDEDDEDDDDEDDEEDEEDEDEQEGDALGKAEKHNQRGHASPPSTSTNFASRQPPRATSTPPSKGAAADEIVRTSSPHPSVDSQSHPAAFSNSDFEEDSEYAEREVVDISQYSSNVGDHSPASVDKDMARSNRSRGTPTFSSLSNSPLPFARHRLPSTAVSDGEACSSFPRRTSFGVVSRQAGRASASPSGYDRVRETRSRDYSRFARPPTHGARTRSSGLLIVGSGTGGQQDQSGSSATALSPPPTLGNRSLSSSAVSRCAPSLGSTSEYAHAHLEPGCSLEAGRGTLDSPGRPICGDSSSGAMHAHRSPDAFTALRSCLESAFAADGQRQVGAEDRDSSMEAGAPPSGSILFGEHGGWRESGFSPSQLSHAPTSMRRPWFTAFSTPGMLSPTRAAFEWSQVEQSGGGGGGGGTEESLADAPPLTLGTPVQIDSSVDGGRRGWP